MNSIDILVKTERGVDELRTRSAKLPQRLRTMLILVDGSLRVADLQQAAAKLGAPDDCLQTLVQLGLVRAPALPAGASDAGSSAGPGAALPHVAPGSQAP